MHGREVCRKLGNLPCAGITLIRFYGCDLSLSAPRDAAKIDYFSFAVTFKNKQRYTFIIPHLTIKF
jgi:hypothetical protein